MNSRANGGISAGDGKNVQNNPPRWQGVQSSHAGVSVQTGLPSRSYEETYTCICCPLGCQLTVMLQQGPAGLDVTGVVGYTCRRGKDYARQEATHPVRMVTAAVPVDGRLCPVSAKTAQPIAKNRMLAALEEIRALRVQPPVHEGDILLENVAGTGVALVATKTVQ
ncbi:DUF1667 domain-containing protein [Slackia isoflavoniconvertens]|uniref:DUF1667 domain-containing protein n=1 Tax=Slackia isoflavoniconvertens TaxID=572010 RepID=A0A369LID2_9ACTN|nr:DUF1667 domain-containing protein [Slackia isoflavoniconvertens]RDB58407.1 hypothetical protein C1881_05780 [Slackia isoflavoniconvertens]